MGLHYLSRQFHLATGKERVMHEAWNEVLGFQAACTGARLQRPAVLGVADTPHRDRLVTNGTSRWLTLVVVPHPGGLYG